MYFQSTKQKLTVYHQVPLHVAGRVHSWSLDAQVMICAGRTSLRVLSVQSGQAGAGLPPGRLASFLAG